MPKKKKEISFVEAVRLLKKAVIESYTERHLNSFQDKPLASPSERVQHIIQFLKKSSTKNAKDMCCFIMYDITDDKIRNYLAKYLLQQGCQRVQKSVYIARMDKKHFEKVHQTLKEVNDMYANDDSIFLVPIGESDLESMKMVGRNVDYSMVVHPPHTLII